jgi:hypothetical protein
VTIESIRCGGGKGQRGRLDRLLAFLAGPPLLGFLGDHVGVLHALLAVVVVTLPALLVVPASRPLPAQR